MKPDENAVIKDNTIPNKAIVLLYLVACALNDKAPKKDIYAGADAEKVLRIAVRHSVVSMAAYALEKSDFEGISAETADRFKKAGYKAVRKNILLDSERDAILTFMESEGLKYLPLKGVIMKGLYPESGMRQMTDNDILIDENDRISIRRFMENRGFRYKKDLAFVHDCYYKEPVYNYEMHTQLFSTGVRDGVYAGYFKDAWSRAVRDNDKKYGYHFSDEDFYIYMTAHAAKHYDGKGTGIRTLADFYVVTRKLAGMDRDYIGRELRKLDLVIFEERIRLLADKLFAAPDDIPDVVATLTDDESSMLAHILNSGTYGTEKQRVIGLMKKRGIDGEITGKKRVIYLLKRLFPDQKTLIPFYPLAKYKILIPAVWIFRLGRGATVKRKEALRELRIVREQKRVD